MANGSFKHIKVFQSKGFTLIELIVVIAIVGILAAILIPKYSGYTDYSKARVCQANRETLERSYAYCLTNGETAVNLTNQTLENYLISKHLISSEFLTCPAGGTITWVLGSGGSIVSGTCSITSHNADLSSSSNAAYALFYDFSKFSTNKFSELITSKDVVIKQGTWAVNSTTGALVPNITNNNPYSMLVKNPKGLEDYTITVNASLSSGLYGGYGISFDTIEDPVTKLDKGYIFQFDRGLNGTGGYVIRPRTGSYSGSGEGPPVTLQSVVPPPSKSSNPSWWTQDHTVSLKVTNVSPTQRMVQAYMDGGTTPVAVYTYTNTLTTTDTVYTGLRTWNGVGAEFNSIEIK